MNPFMAFSSEELKGMADELAGSSDDDDDDSEDSDEESDSEEGEKKGEEKGGGNAAASDSLLGGTIRGGKFCMVFFGLRESGVCLTCSLWLHIFFVGRLEQLEDSSEDSMEAEEPKGWARASKRQKMDEDDGVDEDAEGDSEEDEEEGDEEDDDDDLESMAQQLERDMEN